MSDPLDSTFVVLVTDPGTGVSRKTTISSLGPLLSGQSGDGVIDIVTGAWLYDYQYTLASPPSISTNGTVETVAGVSVKSFDYNEFSAENGVTTLEHTNIVSVIEDYKPKNLLSCTNITAPVLKRIGGSVVIDGCEALEEVDMPELLAVGGDVRISYYVGFGGPFVDLSFPKLTFIGGTLTAANPLTSIEFPELLRVQTLSLITDAATVSFPKLEKVNRLIVGSAASMTTLSLPSCTDIYGESQDGTAGVLVNDAYSLAALDLSAVKRLNSITVTGDTESLTTIDLSAVEKIQQQGNFAYDTIGADAYYAIRCAAGDGAGPTALQTITLNPELKEVLGDVALEICALDQTNVDGILVLLAGLDGTNGTTSFDNFNVTITGTSAAPSVAGTAAIATLTGRGCTVTTN
jgi:hypothetical protein